MENKITINSEVARCIKSIGEDLIKRAEDIARDLDSVTDITIYSKIEGGKIINYDVNKNYSVKTFIHYDALESEVK